MLDPCYPTKVTICAPAVELRSAQEMGRRTYGHDEAADADVRGEPFSYSGELPKNAKEAVGHSASTVAITPAGVQTCNAHVFVFPRVDHAGDDLPDVSAGADEEEDDEEKRVEVEEGGHGAGLRVTLGS